ncbi:MAG: helicase-related protein [Caldisericia bacterium]|nr:helicase-related protein [Caldisericia bacterium]
MIELKEGMIVEGLWNEPVEIISINNLNTYIELVVEKKLSNQIVRQIFSNEDLNKLRELSVFNFNSNSNHIFLSLESLRFRYASIFDPLLAMNITKIDPLPFQIEAVYGYILKLPKIRFLLADDPGAGKTIMAGLVIKELKLRGIVKKILIIVPGHLKEQWIRELTDKFKENFEIIDRNSFNYSYGENPWQKYNQIITSMDFAKQDEILLSLESVEWDLVIVDEAHKMAAYLYGDKSKETDRYKLGKVISKNTKHLLFLTATPHKGDPENFRLFLDLLNPGFFASKELIEESIKNKENPLFIRRMKEDLRDFEGKPLFTRRFVKTIKFYLSDKEKELYNELSKYVIVEYNKALKSDKKRNIAFALLILQRRMASSTYALYESLKRRKRKLEEIYNKKEELILSDSNFSFNKIEELEDYEENERWKIERDWETISVAENYQELKKEIENLDKLIRQAEDIINNEEEVKLKELKKAIEEGFKKIDEIGGNRKILIFTESKDTLDYLVKKIKSWGYEVNSIHGGMSLQERIDAEREFKNRTEVMVATEAAGEGINLQFCHLMINYDIPWNPNRIEQRMGRIHRYGQQKDVHIFNLIAVDTREGTVFNKIFEKLDEIRRALGSDKVFDIIGDVFKDKNLYQLLIEAVSNTKSLDEILKEIEIKVDEDYIRRIKDTLIGETLATKIIDFTRIKEISEKAKENRLIPEYVEEYFKKVFNILNGKLVKKGEFYEIDSVPDELRKFNNDFNFKSKFGTIQRNYRKITFDKETAFKNPDAEFISFGHPLLEAMIEWSLKNYYKELLNGGIFEDPQNKYCGFIYFYEGEVKDGLGEVVGKKIFSIYYDGENLIEVNPSILWDLEPVSDSLSNIENLNFNKDVVINKSIEIIQKYKDELLKERLRQIDIKRKYGIKSLEYLINELEIEMIKYIENNKLNNKRFENMGQRKKDYEEAKKKLEEELENEKNLTISKPKLVGVIYVKPRSKDMMESDKEIERMGMEYVIKYEKEHGREPIDVSKENLGYDIKSKGEKEIRYIEVKARKDYGDIILTFNEFLKAKRFEDDYYLYVVFNVVNKPDLRIIKNPYENIEKLQKIVDIKFIINENEIKNKGEVG